MARKRSTSEGTGSSSSKMPVRAVALSGHGATEFWVANALLGLGWCLSFTAATSFTTSRPDVQRLFEGA